MGGGALRLQTPHDHVEDGVRERVVLPLVGLLLPLLRDRRVLHRDLGRREEDRPAVDGQRAAERRGLLRAGAVHPGDVRGLEAHHLVRAELQETGTRHVRQLVGVRDAERGTGLGRRERPQTDPVGEVRLQAPQAALLQALRGQQQVHAQRTADTADLHEHLDEVRLGGEQLAELVDHQDEGRDRLQRGTRRACLLVVVDVGVVARVAEHFLAAVQLTADGVAHAVDQGQVVREVGDDGRYVRHLRHTREGRTALEVREDEVERLRGVGDGETQYQGAQQFGLAGTGRTDTQAVRAHALLRRLLEVEHHGPAVLADTDRHAQPFRLRAGPPGPLRVDRGGVAQVQQVGELQVGEQRFVVVAARCHAQRCQLTRQRLRRLVRKDVRDPLVDHAVGGLQAQFPGLHDDRQIAASGGEVARHDLQDRHALQALGVGQQGGGRQGDAVEHHHQMRLLGNGRPGGMKTRAALQAGGEPVLQFHRVGADQAHAAGAVGDARGLHVRQPLGPLPFGRRLTRGDDGDDQVLGGVQRGEGGGDGSGRAAHGARLAADRHVVEGAQRHRHRQVVEGAVRRQEALHGAGGQRLQLVDRGGLGWDQRRGQGLRTEAHAHLPEVLVGGAPFPHPAALGDQSPQLLR